jgi:hypothetical protein
MTNTRVEKEQTVTLHRTVKGFYKASVMGVDENNQISEQFSTGWKPNTILNTGLDKIAYMPWAQVFQFCLVGDYPYGPSDTLTASFSEKMLKRPRKINAFYLTGENNCGHKVSGSLVRLYRTFDFYKELDNTTYTEVGFKETPAATTLFSKIRLDPPITLHAGQYLRVNYELRVNMSPFSSSVGGRIPAQYPAFTGWTTGSLDREAIQKIGLCGIDSGSGLAIPIDEGGFCNEPFAPGQISFGPGFGFVNRYYNGSNVNYVPTGSFFPAVSYEQNPFKAVGPLQEFFANYQNPYQFLDLGISASLSVNNGRYSGSYCIPNTTTYKPRNYFTSDLFYQLSQVFSNLYTGTGTNWAVDPPSAGTDQGDTTETQGTYYVSQTNTNTPTIGVWGFKSGVTIADTAVYYASAKFTKLDNLWTPYSKLATLSSITGVTPKLSTYNNNTNLFNDFFYDPSMQNSGSLSYPKFPSRLMVPGGKGTGSKYEIEESAATQTTVEGKKMIAGDGVIDKKIPTQFFYWDDWNPYQTTASLASMPLWVRRTGWTGTSSPTSGRKLGTNYYVRGSSCFLSTFSGSATSSFNANDRSRNSATKIFSVELPMYLNPYTQSTYTRDKVVIFSNGVANNEDIPNLYRPDPAVAPLWRTIGVGPTSISLTPEAMNDAAKNNGYVYVLQNGQTKSKDYSLKMVFRYTWGRG